MDEEKRSAQRFRINQLIGYYPNREEYLWAEGLNLSAGGMQCAAQTPIDPLTNIFVMIGVPSPEGEKLVRCEGFVTYSRMEGSRCLFGLKFEHVAEEDRHHLDDYLATLDAQGLPGGPSPGAR